MHKVGKLNLEFTGRTSWKARVYRGKELVADAAPVCWRRDFKNGTVLVWPRKGDAFSGAFVVAIAEAKDNNSRPMEFKEFISVFEVELTGGQITDDRTGHVGLEARVMRRIT
jgi:hypothetical protein